MSTDIPETQEEKARALVRCVRSLGELLGAIRETNIAQAFTESSDEDALERYMERRGRWSHLFQEIANDMEKNIANLAHSKTDTAELLTMTKRAMGILNSPEFEQSIQKLEQFIGLFERLERIKQSGFLGDVLNSIRTV